MTLSSDRLLSLLQNLIQQAIRRPLAYLRPRGGWYDRTPVFLAPLEDPGRNPHHPWPGISIGEEGYLREGVVTILRKPHSLDVRVHRRMLKARGFEPRWTRLIQVLNTYGAGVDKALDHAEQETGRAMIRLDLEDGCSDDHAAVRAVDSFYAFARQKRFPAVGLLPDPYTLGDIAGGVSFPRFADERSAREVYRERKPLVFWRGVTTGRPPARRTGENRRVNFCIDALRFPESIDAKITGVVQFPSNPTAFRELLKAGVMAPQVPETAFEDYQATVDLDGNASAWGGLRKHLRMMHVIRPAGPNEMFYHVGQPTGTFTSIESLEELFQRVGEAPRLADNFEVAWRGYLYARDVLRRIVEGNATVWPANREEGR